MWLVVNNLTALPADSLLVKIIDTTLGIGLLYTLLVILQGLVSIAAARSRAPRLLYDIALTVLMAVGGAVIISAVWDLSLTGLLSAVGVGSVVMGLALQNVVGGMVSGVLLLSARQFNIGDWLRTGGGIGRIIQVDWHSVTLRVSGTERLVLPSASLASSSFNVISGDQPATASVSVMFGYKHPPEEVRAMLLQAARGVSWDVAPDGATCKVTAFTGSGIAYKVGVAVADLSRTDDAVDELLSRMWYVAQRHGMSVIPGAPEGADNLPTYGRTTEERAAIIATTGALRRPADALVGIAESARLQRWRSGETVTAQGAVVGDVLLVVRGAVRVVVNAGVTKIEMDCLRAGQIFAVREAFRGAACPVEVAAEGETELMAIPASAMQALLDRDPALADDFESVLETRVQALTNMTGAAQDGRAAALHRAA
jgi:small-conductance mechanosensitive channel/CRP-like cAMP-binding protein